MSAGITLSSSLRGRDFGAADYASERADYYRPRPLGPPIERSERASLKGRLSPSQVLAIHLRTQLAAMSLQPRALIGRVFRRCSARPASSTARSRP
jgi:hypothetical protein